MFLLAGLGLYHSLPTLNCEVYTGAWTVEVKTLGAGACALGLDEPVSWLAEGLAHVSPQLSHWWTQSG